MRIAKKLTAVLLTGILILCSLPIHAFAAPESLEAQDVASIRDVSIFNGHAYKIYRNTSIGWHEAQEFCESVGGHLATVTDEEEDSFIRSMVVDTGLSFWLGATDERSEGEWRWVTGEAWEYSNAEFDNCDGVQHYLVVNHYYDCWDDQSEKETSRDGDLCDTGGFICEWDRETASETFFIGDRQFDRGIDYYTSKWKSHEYNPTLSNQLAALSYAAYDEREIEIAYQTLGFTQGFGSHYESFGGVDLNFCCYTIGFKKSEYNDDWICLITVRGSHSVSDWLYNLDIATSEEKHQGFLIPALGICNTIADAMLDQMISLQKVKFVITGHSRGAAIGNLLAVELMEQGVWPDNLYNYNFACPDVACKSEFPIYNNIFNLCNTDDLVAFVPGAPCDSFVTSGKSWGKYGRTFWFTKDVDGFFKSHAMSLYLDFFDQKISPNDFPFSLDSMSSGVLVKVFCPVDVVITDPNEKIIASVVDGEVGYYEEHEREILIFTDGDRKVIYLRGAPDFLVNLIGTDSGTMIYSVEALNYVTGERLATKTFCNVALEKGKTMQSPVGQAEQISDVELFVTEKTGGEIIYTNEINPDGTETPTTVAFPDREPSNDAGGNGASGQPEKNESLNGNDGNRPDLQNRNLTDIFVVIGIALLGAGILCAVFVLVFRRIKRRNTD